MLVPVSLVLRGEDSQLLAQGPVESFHQPITLRPQGSGAGLVYAQTLTHGVEHPGLEIPPLVTVKVLRHSKAAEHALHQGIYYRLCLLVWEGIRLWPFGKVVYGREDIPVTPV